eukprot:SAG11_NODE_73_length_18072_cov_8.670005_4_plen_69_part_00
MRHAMHERRKSALRAAELRESGASVAEVDGAVAELVVEELGAGFGCTLHRPPPPPREMSLLWAQYCGM